MSALDDELLDLMRFAAERSIMPRFRNLAEHEVEEKAKDDLVTIADRETEEFLTEALTRLQPGVPVVGEEAAAADPAIMDRLSGACWIIDPIDGTSNFARGEGHFAIMIALANEGETIAGWIYDPQRGRYCRAQAGAGAFIDEEQVSALPSGNARPNLAAMKRFMGESQRAIFETEIEPRYNLVEAPGCAAEQYPLTAIGGHDLAIYERTLPWDHAAGCLFLNEAGGACLRMDGTPYRVDDGRKGMLGAASRQLFDDLAMRLSAAGYEPAASGQ